MLMQRELGCLEIPMLDGKVVWDADLEGRLVWAGWYPRIWERFVYSDSFRTSTILLDFFIFLFSSFIIMLVWLSLKLSSFLLQFFYFH